MRRSSRTARNPEERGEHWKVNPKSWDEEGVRALEQRCRREGGGAGQPGNSQDLGDSFSGNKSGEKGT